MLFRNRKQNRRSNRRQQSQRRNATTRRIQLLERLEDRRLMAVAGGFEEQLLRFELNRGEYSRSLRDQVQQDRYRPGRVELRRAARTAPAQQVDNSATDIQQPGQNEQPVSPDGEEKKPEIEKKSGDANEPNGGNETKSDSSPEGKDPTDEATAKLNELKSDAADSVKVDEIDVSELSQPSSIFEGVEWNLDRRLRTGRDAGRSRLRTDPKDELESGGEEKNPKVENETPGQKDPTEENGGNEQESSRWDLTPEEQEVLRKESSLSEDQMNELFKEGRLDLGSKTFFINRWSDGSPTISIGIKCSFPGDWPLDGENQDPQTEPAGGTGPGEAITPEDPSTETPGDSGNDSGNETGSELGVGVKKNPNPLGNVPAKGDGQQPPVPVNPNNGAPSILADLQQQRADLQRQYQENERRQREVRVGDEGIVVDEVAFISLLEEMHYLQDRLSELDEAIESFNPKNQEVGQGANVVNVISADQIGDLMQDLKSDDPQVREKAADTLFKALQEFSERLGFLGNLSDVDRQFIMDFVEQFAATDQQTRDAVVDQLRKYIVENELSSIGAMSILESQLREHGKSFQLPEYVSDPGTDDPVDEDGNGDNGPGKDGGEKQGQELENGNQKNENPVGDVPAKPDEEQPPVAGNPNNGAAEQTLEELQKKRAELERQHQENERQQNELDKAGEEGPFDEDKFDSLLNEMQQLRDQLRELDQKILEQLQKKRAEVQQQHQENERQQRELDQKGELGAAEDAELRRLLDEMHNLRDQLEELDKKIGGITSQNAVNGQEDPAGENPGDAEQPQKLNFSPEEKEAFRRRFGLSEDQMDELLEEGSLKDKGRIFSVFEHADGPPMILVTETDPGPAVDNPNDKEEKAGTPEDQKSDQKGNGDKPDDSQEPKDPDNGKKQGALDGTDKLASRRRRRIVVVDSLPPVIQLTSPDPGKYESSRDTVYPDAGAKCRDYVDGQLPPQKPVALDGTGKLAGNSESDPNCRPNPRLSNDPGNSTIEFANGDPVAIPGSRKSPSEPGVNKKAVDSLLGNDFNPSKVEDLPDLTDPNVPAPFSQPQPHDLIWGNGDFTKGVEKQPQGQVEKAIQPNQAKLEDGVEDCLSESETRLLESARERARSASTEHGRAVAEANAAAEALRKCEKDVAELRDKHDASKAEVDAAKDALKKAEAELENYQSDVDAASREWDRVDRQFWAYAKYRSIVRGQDGRTSERYREAQGQLDRGNDQHNEAGRRYSEIKGSLADRQAAVAAAKENLKAAQAAEQAAQKALNAKEKECQRVDEKQGQANAAETRAAKEVDQANTAAQETATQVTKSSKLRREAAEARRREQSQPRSLAFKSNTSRELDVKGKKDDVDNLLRKVSIFSQHNGAATPAERTAATQINGGQLVAGVKQVAIEVVVGTLRAAIPRVNQAVKLFKLAEKLHGELDQNDEGVVVDQRTFINGIRGRTTAKTVVTTVIDLKTGDYVVVAHLEAGSHGNSGMGRRGILPPDAGNHAVIWTGRIQE